MRAVGIGNECGSFSPTTPSASPRQGTELTRSDPMSQVESTLHWVPLETGVAVLHLQNACDEREC